MVMTRSQRRLLYEVIDLVQDAVDPRDIEGLSDAITGGLYDGGDVSYASVEAFEGVSYEGP
jgi:hypothetical protein